MMAVDFVKVFIVGGLLCALAQLLIDKTAMTGARIMVLYVVLGVGLTAVGLYDYVVDFGKSGATVPIIGFGYTLAQSTRQAIDTNGLLGVFTGGLSGTAAGIAATVEFAVLWALLFRSKQK